jgi:hypothetical protein
MEEENISIKSLSLPFYTLGLTQMYVHGKAILFFFEKHGKAIHHRSIYASSRIITFKISSACMFSLAKPDNSLGQNRFPWFCFLVGPIGLGWKRAEQLGWVVRSDMTMHSRLILWAKSDPFNQNVFLKKNQKVTNLLVQWIGRSKYFSIITDHEYYQYF